jgi:hypothetical protein
MKQLLSLFLFLLPCLAWAQYPSNGNQKITLGEQTTADGLIWRGVLADTGIITPSSDTSAYIILDTVNHRFYNYNRATNVWSMAGVGSISSGLTGVLPVANGGTGSATQNFVDLTNTQTVGGAKTFSSTVTGARFDPTSSSASGTGMYLPAANSLGFSTSGTEKMRILSNGNVGIGVANPIATLDIGSIGAGEIAMRDLDGTNLYLAFGHNNGESTFNTRNGNSRGSYNFYSQNSAGVVSFMYIDITGKMGIGTTEPSQFLHVVGNARITAMNGINDIGADANGVLQAATSDMNLKNTIENSPFGLNEILLLNPVTFLYNDTNRKIDSDVKEVGFIAQDVFDIIPNAVSSTGTGDLQLDYRSITATLVKAIQEQQALIKSLEQRIINLENK